MKTGTPPLRWFWPVLACATLTALPALHGDPLPLREKLRDALYKEEVDRDPEAAAKGYQQLLEENDAQRAFAATAQFRLAEVRRKQGRKDEAIAAYQTLLTRYPEAETECRVARENLKAMGVAATDQTAPPIQEDDDEQNLRRLMELEKSAPDQLPGEFRPAIDNGRMKSLEFLLTHSNPPPFRQGESYEWPIEFADRVESLAAVKVLLKHNSDPKDPGNRAALFSAAENNHVHIMKALLEAGLDPNGKEPARYPISEPSWAEPDAPLSQAVRKGSTEVIDLLMAAKADVNQARDITGQTALHYAVERGDTALVKRLLEAGANPNAIAHTGAETAFLGISWNDSKYSLEPSALDIAVCKAANLKQSSEVVEVLEKAGAKMNDSRLLLLAKDQPKLWQALLAHGLSAGPLKEISGSLLASSYQDFFHALLQHGLKLDFQNFAYCLENASDQTLQTIFDQQAYAPDFLKDERLSKLKLRKGKALALLAEKGVPVSDDRVIAAASAGDVELLKVLLDHGGNAKAMNPAATGDPFLFHPDTRVAIALLEHGADPNVLNSHHQTPLMVAFDHGQTDLAKALLEHGADPNFPAQGSALLAAQNEDLGLMPLLLEKGAKPSEEWLNSGFSLLGNDPAGESEGRSLLFRAFMLPRMKESPNVTWVSQWGKIVTEVLEPRSPSKLPRSLAEQVYHRLSSDDSLSLSSPHLIVWRSTPGGGPRQRIDVNLTDSAPYPVLEWGDIIDATEARPQPVDPFKPFEDFREAVRRHIHIAVTLEMDGVSYPYILNGNLDTFDVSKNEIRYFDTLDLMFLISQRKLTWNVEPSYKIIRENWPPLEIQTPSNAETATPIYLTDGDRLVWKTKEGTADKQAIRVSSPDLPYLRTVGFGSVSEYLEPYKTGESFDPDRVIDAARPTLLQAIASAYSQDGSGILIHPDFSRIRIRRWDKEGRETPLVVNLQERMEQLPGNFSAEQARAIDERLRCGDMVEIPVQPGMAGNPWEGFSPLMQRVMERALSYQVQITNSQHQVTLAAIDYHTPRFSMGAHGPVREHPAEGTDDPSLGSVAGKMTLSVIGKDGRHIGSFSPGFMYPNGRDQYVEVRVPLPSPDAPTNRQPRPRVAPVPPASR